MRNKLAYLTSLFKNEITGRKFTMIHHVDQRSLDEFYSGFAPVFFLNTGRSGSAFLDNLLKQIDGVDAHHEAFPNLMMYPDYAFHNQKEKVILKKIFEAARTELMLNSFIQGKTYVETNHCLVFFAYQIKELFPNARFVHVLRHPGDFVRSAIMKGWHKNDSIWENNRIKMNDVGKWNNLSQIEKLSWLWNETHLYIEQFLESVPSKQSFKVKLEDMVTTQDHVKQVIKFIDKDFVITQENIEKLQAVKVNENIIGENEPSTMYKLHKFLKYDNWAQDDKNKLKQYAQNQALKYGYHL